MNKNVYTPDLCKCTDVFKSKFKYLSDRELRMLVSETSVKMYKKGSIIYEEGARIDGCYFVCSGIIKIFQTGKEGKDQIMRIEPAGNIFGFRSVIQKEVACSSVSTLTDSVLCYIPDSVLMYLIKNNSEFAYSMIKIACSELGDSNKYIKDIAQKTVKERLAEILLKLADDFGLEEDGTLQLNITREELSNFVGTATETVIRLLSDYKSEGLLESKGRKIRLLNINKLRLIAKL